MNSGLISIIIPAKNEEANILLTISGIQHVFDIHSPDYEIIVVNDGSTDKTYSLVSQLNKQNGRIRAIDNVAPHGIGRAIQRGLNEYKGDIVIITMADAADDPADMVKFVQEINNGYDCCFGMRWGKGFVKDYPHLKWAFNRLGNFMISFLFGLKYTDVSNAFKAYSRDVIENIKPLKASNFDITVELPLKAILQGYTYKILDNNWYVRKKGRSHFLLKEFGSGYLRIVFEFWKEKYFIKPDQK